MSSTRDFIRMISELFIVCGLAAGSLAVVNMVTKEPIAHWEKQQKEDALKVVFTNADEFEVLEADKIWEARCNGRKTGNAFLTRFQGYSGPITLMFGIDVDGAITGLHILSHTETPGLGAKIASPRFREQFKNKGMEDLALKKDNPAKGRIDAITGATISSRAVTKAMRSTLEPFCKEKDGVSK